MGARLDQNKILKLELEIKYIFNKEVIRAVDVVRANKLIEEWKILTNYTSDKTPAVLDYVDILDNPIINRRS